MKLMETLSKENIGKLFRNNRYGVFTVDESEEGLILLEYPKGKPFFLSTKYLVEEVELVTVLTDWDRVENSKSYFYIDTQGQIQEHLEIGSIEDDRLFSNKNYFHTKELAKQVNLCQLLQRKIWEYRDLKDIEESIDSIKYTIYFKSQDIDNLLVLSKGFSTSSIFYTRNIGAIYFNSEEVAENCIADVVIPFFEEHKEEESWKNYLNSLGN